ncbi:MAG: crossover junction endodeoxyribonuclease RuvC [Ruminococcaceae bacterium]|nr:crossover junction endodeoxyribonuclease RuvC [Oscillospiraceae bacterium]
MIILGIDPGIAIVGYGVIDYSNNRFHVLDYGAITTPAHTPVESRLEMIYSDMNELIKNYSPQCMAIEELFFNSNQKTAISVAQARGVILLAARKNGLDIREYTPLQVKQAVVGYGRAEKQQVQSMITTILGLKKVPKPDDTADALALAVCDAHCGDSRLRGYFNN